MDAKDIRDIWQKEVKKQTNFFINYIKEEILKRTFQEGIWIFSFDYKFNNLEDCSQELISEVLANTKRYFESLGFITKEKENGILLTYDPDSLQENAFTRNLMFIQKTRIMYSRSGKKSVLNDLLALIKDNALREKEVRYQLTLNTPNENCLSIHDVKDILKVLTERGFEVRLEKKYDVEDLVINLNKPLFPEPAQVTLHINW
ncbi:MAG: hypothetical protein ACOWWO_13510 [Peptococcaceae bacterium]